MVCGGGQEIEYFDPETSITGQACSTTWAVVVVKWSVCSPSIPTIQVQIQLKPLFFSVKFVFEKNESKQKRPGMDHLKNICYY